MEDLVTSPTPVPSTRCVAPRPPQGPEEMQCPSPSFLLSRCQGEGLRGSRHCAEHHGPASKCSRRCRKQGRRVDRLKNLVTSDSFEEVMKLYRALENEYALRLAYREHFFISQLYREDAVEGALEQRIAHENLICECEQRLEELFRAESTMTVPRGEDGPTVLSESSDFLASMREVQGLSDMLGIKEKESRNSEIRESFLEVRRRMGDIRRRWEMLDQMMAYEKEVNEDHEARLSRLRVLVIHAGCKLLEARGMDPKSEVTLFHSMYSEDGRFAVTADPSVVQEFLPESGEPSDRLSLVIKGSLVDVVLGLWFHLFQSSMVNDRYQRPFTQVPSHCFINNVFDHHLRYGSDFLKDFYAALLRDPQLYLDRCLKIVTLCSNHPYFLLIVRCDEAIEVLAIPPSDFDALYLELRVAHRRLQDHGKSSDSHSLINWPSRNSFIKRYAI